MTAAWRGGTVVVMRFAHGSAFGRWRSSVVEDVCLAAVLLAAAELEVVLDGLGADSAALAALGTLPLALRRRLPIVSFACVAVLAPTLDRALGTPWDRPRTHSCSWSSWRRTPWPLTHHCVGRYPQ